MRIPRMSTRRWMIATAVLAALCALAMRADALQRRAAFHAQEQQWLMQEANVWETEYRRLSDGRYCGDPIVIVETNALLRFVVPQLLKRAAYHAELVVRYRRAALYPWILAPAERPFVPDIRQDPAWLRARADDFRSLESRCRDSAKVSEKAGELDVTAGHIRRAQEYARSASDYDRRAMERDHLDASGK